MSSENDGDCQSTNSALGDIIKEHNLDENALNLEFASALAATASNEDFATLQPVDTKPVLEDGQHVQLDSDQQFVVDFVLHPSQLPKVEQEEEGTRPKSEGEQIMEMLHGFGKVQPGGPPAIGVSPQTRALSVQDPPKIGGPNGVRVVILEQPEKKVRFRYMCEGRSAGAMQGETSTNEHKTYPTIQILNYQGPAKCVVSLVEHNPPHRAHPHSLVGKDGTCKHGVCSVEIKDMLYSFQSLGIQCARKKDIPEWLEHRQKIKVDPYKQGFDHKGGSIDLNQVRLCFQVFLSTGGSLVPLKPVVSNVIKHKKAHADLVICEYSDDRCTVEGGKKLLLFCEKVTKEDIEVHFLQYTKRGEKHVAKGEFSANDVHHQYGICLKTPPHINKDITQPEQCHMYLHIPKTQASSEPVEFWYLPSSAQQEQQLGAIPRQLGAAAGAGDLRLVSQPHKRGREPKGHQDPPSSGSLIVPNKVSPAQLHGGGGRVVSVTPLALHQGSNNIGSYIEGPRNDLNLGTTSPHNFAPPRSSPYEQVTLDQVSNRLILRPTSGVAATAVVAAAVRGGEEKVSEMTKEVQELFRADTGEAFNTVPAGSSPGQPQNNFAVPLPYEGGPNPEPVGPQMTNLNAFLQSPEGNFLLNSEAPGASGTLPHLSLSGADLTDGDIDSLSSKLDSRLSIEKTQNSEAQQPGFTRQTSQLHTPDVSSISVDGASSSVAAVAVTKKNNLNK